MDNCLCQRKVCEFVSLGHLDIHTHIDTLTSIQVIYAITRLDFIILPFLQFGLVKSWKKYIEPEREIECLSHYQLEPELKYWRLHTSALNTIFPITLRSQFPNLGQEKIVIRISFVINFSHLIVDFTIIWYAACYTFQTVV